MDVSHYTSLELPPCRHCGESKNVRKVVTGMPTKEIIQYSVRIDSKILLGCCGMKSIPFYCLSCGKSA